MALSPRVTAAAATTVAGLLSCTLASGTAAADPAAALTAGHPGGSSVLVRTPGSTPAGSPVPVLGTLSLPTLAPRPADSLVDAYGVNVHVADKHGVYGDSTQVGAALTALGARHVRTTLYSNIPEQWAALRALYSRGIRSDLTLASPDAKSTPAQLVQVMAQQFPPGLVDSVEGANEWNLSGDRNWVQTDRTYQQQIWEAVKGDPATSGIPVLAPSLGMRSGFGDLGDVSRWADAGNVHMYSGGQAPDVDIDENIAAEQAVTPGKPVVFTETGYHNAMNTPTGHVPTPEDVVGVYAPRLLLDHFSKGVSRVYTYELLDEWNDPGHVNKEAEFGLLRRDFTPKPAFVSMSRLLHLVADPGPAYAPQPLAYSVTGATPDVRQVLLGKRDGSYDLVLWRDVSVYDRLHRVGQPVVPVTVSVGLPRPSRVEAYDPSASSVPLSSADGLTSTGVTLGGDVVVLHVAPSSAEVQLAPGAPQAVVAEPRDGGTAVSWQAPSAGAPVTGYRVTAAPAGGGAPATTTVEPAARSAVLTTLQNGRAYAVAVVALSDTVAGPPTAAAGLIVPVPRPAAVSGVVAAARDAAALVRWVPAAVGSRVESYTVVANHGGGSITVPATSTEAVFPGLTNGTPYAFSVVANGTFGSSAASAPSLAVLPVAVPGAVSHVRVTSDVRSLAVRWSPPTSGGSVRSYVLLTEPATYPHVVPGTASEAVVVGLRTGVSYTVRVVPMGVAGPGPGAVSRPHEVR